MIALNVKRCETTTLNPTVQLSRCSFNRWICVHDRCASQNAGNGCWVRRTVSIGSKIGWPEPLGNVLIIYEVNNEGFLYEGLSKLTPFPFWEYKAVPPFRRPLASKETRFGGQVLGAPAYVRWLLALAKGLGLVPRYRGTSQAHGPRCLRSCHMARRMLLQTL